MKPTPEQVTIGRLRKRIAKLTMQRNHWKAESDAKQNVLDCFPRIQREYQSYSEQIAASERVKALEARVREQELLIKKLTEIKP